MDFPGVSAAEPPVHGSDHHRLPAHHLLPDLAAHPQGLMLVLDIVLIVSMIYRYMELMIYPIYRYIEMSKGSICITDIRISDITLWIQRHIRYVVYRYIEVLNYRNITISKYHNIKVS